MKEKIFDENEKPPIMKSWSRLYWAVILNLVFWLTLFYIFRKVFE